MNRKPACLVVDQMHPSIFPMLEEIGFTVRYEPEIKASEVKALLPDFEGLIVRSKLTVTSELLEAAVNLKFVARAGAGVDNVDLSALAIRNITLINAPEGNRDAVGEFAVGLLLALFRQIPAANQEVKAGIWQREKNRGEEISDKTIGLIGYGNMGKAFARRLSGFGCRVLAYDADAEKQFDSFAERATLDELFANADVVSFHIPFSPENFHFGNQGFFLKFRKNIWVLNTARGEIMDYSALVEKIRSGKILGAGLDVMENEKLHTLTPAQKENYEYLVSNERVVITPHIAGWSHRSYVKINETLAGKIKKLMAEEKTLL